MIQQDLFLQMKAGQAFRLKILKLMEILMYTSLL